MKRLFLSLALVLAGRAAAFAIPEQALGNLLDAVSAGGAVFDGSRPGSPLLLATPAAVKAAKPAAVLAPASKKAATAAPQAAAQPDVQPVPAKGISDGSVGLYSEDDLVVGTGRCSACRGPMEGKWYFLDDVIATPKAGPPALVWIGSHEMIEGATLSEDGASVRLKDGSSLPFELTPKIDMNRSYYDPTSLAFFRGRTLRIRGEYAERNGVRTLVARTIWPEDFRIDAASLKEADAKSAADVDAMISADHGGAKSPFQAKLLWERSGAGRAWEGKPVMGVMVNGAQGDDDEALAGHFSFFTGRYGPNGSMADWVFDNFYDMNTVSEKGIIASMVPMDKYMTDLNSGQSWYRPSYVLVMVMKDPRVPLELQGRFTERYAQYYSQKIKYDHTHENCTALIADPVRQEGWKYPETGMTPTLIARAIAAVAGKVAKDPKAGEQIFESLREEPTRSFPRASFDSVGGDLLVMEQAFGADPISREFSPLERRIQEDLLAVLFVRLPQIPSSRKFGRDAVGGVLDYMTRTGGKIKQTVPTEPRPFPPPH